MEKILTPADVTTLAKGIVSARKCSRARAGYAAERWEERLISEANRLQALWLGRLRLHGLA